MVDYDDREGHYAIKQAKSIYCCAKCETPLIFKATDNGRVLAFCETCSKFRGTGRGQQGRWFEHHWKHEYVKEIPKWATK